MKRNPLAFFCLLGTVAWLSSCSAVRQCKAPELNLPERMADVGPDTLSVARYEMVAVLRRYAIVQDHRADAFSQ